jgi:hypothetical protein
LNEAGGRAAGSVIGLIFIEYKTGPDAVKGGPCGIPPHRHFFKGVKTRRQNDPKAELP